MCFKRLKIKLFCLLFVFSRLHHAMTLRMRQVYFYQSFRDNFNGSAEVIKAHLSIKS